MRTIWIIVFITGTLLGMLLTYLTQAVLGAAAHPDPSLQVKDWLTTAFALVAVVLSAGALYFNWMKSKQDTFLSIHDKLISLDIQEGRRLLFAKIRTPEDADKLLAESVEEYQKINRALAMYDVLGVYVKRRYVFKSWVMEEWGPGLAKARVPGKHFITHRSRQGVPSTWKNFDRLTLEAKILAEGEKTRSP